jgi:hypothetical protein
MNKEIENYNNSQATEDIEICDLLAKIISEGLPEAEHKIWHGHPVWFLDGNPIVGYSKLKTGIRLLFWSGQSFGDDTLQKEGKFKAADIRYTKLDEVNTEDILRWLNLAKDIQWDYKNLVKRKGVLERLK